ncbi:MAG: 7-cyano-7-deazaguanine synthase [Solirubrobacterales bacterium]
MSVGARKRQASPGSAAILDQGPTIHLLWTGGWDSTFRLIDLLLARKRRVQPHYILDASRRSTDHELRAMTELRDLLERRDAAVRHRLRPTHFRDLREIRPDVRIHRAFERLRGRRFVGLQYEYLARFAHEQGLEDLEVAIHWEADGPDLRSIQHCVTATVTDAGRSFRLDTTAAGAAERAVFGRFSFPLYELTKLDMQRIAEERGVADLMELTWFCHRPRRDGSPCGSCIPCSYTIEAGLSRRVPIAGRVRYRLSPLRRVNPWLREHPRLHALYLRLMEYLGPMRSLARRSARRLSRRDR